MINKVKLKIKNGNHNFEFKPQPINIIVGPNNSGKSLFLKELLSNLGDADHRSTIELKEYLILHDTILRPISYEDLDEFKSTSQESNGQHIFISSPTRQNFRFSKTDINNFNTGQINGDNQKRYWDFKRIILDNKLLLLDGVTRLSSMDFKAFTTEDTARYNSETFDNAIDKAIKDDFKFSKIQDYIYEAFGVYTEILLNGSEACFVLSKVELDETMRLSIRPETIKVLKKADNRDKTSDGRKAYLGIISEILTRDPDIILLDEPEAFLHPPLSRKLGNVISKLADSESKQIFASTHSSDFIMGCIESHIPLNIIRLNYDNEIASVTSLDSNMIEEIMMNPLLRSTNIIDGIFYKHVIVTESDSDRAFYQEINKRLLDYKPDWGIEDCLFLNAQNKQTVGTIVSMLRKIGVPAVSIIDLDMIKDGGSVFKKYLESPNIPGTFHESLIAQKNSLKNKFKNDSNYIKELNSEGLYYLLTHEPASYELGISFLNTLKDYGQFVVPVGELESWLKDLNDLTNHGNNWLMEVFSLMGSDPSNESYVKPSDKDVWAFIYEIKEWLNNPQRKGMG